MSSQIHTGDDKSAANCFGSIEAFVEKGDAADDAY